MAARLLWPLLLLLTLRPGPALAVVAWPGETWATATDLTPLNPTGWASNLSGAFWNPTNRRLWVCTNNPARFWALRENGPGGFAIEREYTGTGDLEGITQISTAADRVLVLDEQARTIRSYRVSDGATLTTWFLDAITDWGNSGPEGLAFVPNAWLAASGFVDGNGALYPQSVHGALGFGGIVFVAVQTSGWVYAFDLRVDGTWTFVGRYLTSRTESCELTFDASTGSMFILHNTGSNYLETTDLTSTLSSGNRRFITRAELQVPSPSNIEGFAATPAVDPLGHAGDGWCFFTDDDNASGALRWFRQIHSTLARVAGDGQVALTGTAVPVAPSVLARDPFLNVTPGLIVTFAVTGGGGTLTGASPSTGPSGVAAVGSWILGPAPGTNTLAASVAGFTGSPQSFTATGIDATPPTVTIQPVLPDPRTTRVDSIVIVFSEPVTGFDRADLELHLDGGPDLLTEVAAPTSADRVTWLLQTTFQTASLGTYELNLKSGGVQDDTGNVLALGASESWLMYASTGVEPLEPAGPGLRLGPPAPNPARGMIQVPFTLPAEEPVELKVFDLRGRQVATLVQSRLGAGEHRASWNGRGSDDRPVPSGIYLLRLHAGGATMTRTALLLR